MAFAGTIVGMLVFGAMSDFIGRKVGMLIAVRPSLLRAHARGAVLAVGRP